jgi:hypothetical protein
MIESAHGPTTPWTDRALLAVLFASVIVAATYVAIVAAGGRVFPAPLNEIIFLALTTSIVGVTIVRVADRMMRSIDRVDRRLVAVQSALVRHGVQLAEVTGEIPRITSELPSPGPRDEDMNGYAMGYADGLARKPIVGKVVPFTRGS